MKGNILLYLVSPPMTLLCKEIPNFRQFKSSEWIHAVTISGKSIYVQKRNISLAEEVSQEKFDKVKEEAQKGKLIKPSFAIPGGRVS